MSTDQVKDMLNREKGRPAPSEDLMSRLRSADGNRFDDLLAEKMEEGHAELVRMVENAQPTLNNDRVRSLVDRTLPTLRQHRHIAERLEDQPPD